MEFMQQEHFNPLSSLSLQHIRHTASGLLLYLTTFGERASRARLAIQRTAVPSMLWAWTIVDSSDYWPV